MARREEFKHPIENDSEFVLRKRNNFALTSLLLYAIGLVALFLGAGLAKTPMHLMLFALITMGIPTIFAFYNIKRSIDLVTGVEFQNALFSSAISKHHDFFCFADKQGNVVYTDPRLKNYLPDLDRSNAYESLADMTGLSGSERLRMLDAAMQERREYFTFSLASPDGKKQPMRLSLEPVARPKGYFIIQGRAFVTARSEEQNALTKNAIPLKADDGRLQRMVNELPFGVYCTSPSGHFRAINSTLEEWLGYDQNEMIAKNLRIDDVIYTPDGQEKLELNVNDSKQEVKLKKKNASLLRVTVKQHAQPQTDGYIDFVAGHVKLIDKA